MPENKKIDLKKINELGQGAVFLITAEEFEAMKLFGYGLDENKKTSDMRREFYWNIMNRINDRNVNQNKQ